MTTKKTTKTPVSKKPSAKSATPKTGAPVGDPPEPAKLTATPVRDKTTGRWGWCLRDRKVEHHESKDTFDTEADATADGEKWLAEYARPDADRRKMLGWKPASSKNSKAPTGAAKTAKTGKPAKTDKAMSCLDAAAKVLGETKAPMNTKDMIEAMSAKDYWKSKSGKTPAATHYAAILRETQTKGAETRFKKTDRGLFALAGKA